MKINYFLYRAKLALFVMSALLSPQISWSGGIRSCPKILSNKPPSLEFPFTRFIDLPEGIFLKKGWPIYRGFSGNLTDSQVEKLFKKKYGYNSIISVSNPREEKKVRAANRLDKVKELTSNQLGVLVQNHASGVQQNQSPWLSTSFDIGVANYFSTLGEGDRSFIVQSKAPADAINVVALSNNSRSYVDRGEGEILVPIKIKPSDIIQVLEITLNTRGRNIVSGRWFVSDKGKVKYEPLDEIVLPYRMSAFRR